MAKVPASSHSEIVRRYQEGESLRELAESFGCSAPTVSNILKKNGVERRPRGRNRPAKEEEDSRQTEFTFRRIVDV